MATNEADTRESLVRGPQTTERVARVAHEAVDRFAGKAGTTEQRLREAATEAGNRLQQGSEQAQQKADETATMVRGYMQQHPLVTVAIVFSAGVLASALLRRG